MSYVVVAIYRPAAGPEALSVYATSDGSLDAAQALAARLRRTTDVPAGGQLSIHRRRLVEAADLAEVLGEVLLP